MFKFLRKRGIPVEKDSKPIFTAYQRYGIPLRYDYQFKQELLGILADKQAFHNKQLRAVDLEASAIYSSMIFKTPEAFLNLIEFINTNNARLTINYLYFTQEFKLPSGFIETYAKQILTAAANISSLGIFLVFERDGDILDLLRLLNLKITREDHFRLQISFLLQQHYEVSQLFEAAKICSSEDNLTQISFLHDKQFSNQNRNYFRSIALQLKNADIGKTFIEFTSQSIGRDISYDATLKNASLTTYLDVNDKNALTFARRNIQDFAEGGLDRHYARYTIIRREKALESKPTCLALTTRLLPVLSSHYLENLRLQIKLEHEKDLLTLLKHSSLLQCCGVSLSLTLVKADPTSVTRSLWLFMLFMMRRAKQQYSFGYLRFIEGSGNNNTWASLFLDTNFLFQAIRLILESCCTLQSSLWERLDHYTLSDTQEHKYQEIKNYVYTEFGGKVRHASLLWL